MPTRPRRPRPRTSKADKGTWHLCPTRYLLCDEDRLLYNDFWREAAQQRLGVEPEEMPGSHSPMASRAEDLARRLAA